MKNKFYFLKYDNSYLLTNDNGEFIFLKPDVFQKFVNNKISKTDIEYQDLINKHFIYENQDLFLEEMKHKIRRYKNYLFSPTSLFIYVVTTKCNHSCVYCQANCNSDTTIGIMNKKTAKRSVEIMMECPNDSISVEFQGGEPLINFEIIKFIVEYTLELNAEYKKEISFSIVSNLTLLTDDIIDFIEKYKISLSTSLDGNKLVHNKNRRMNNNQSSYDVVAEKIEKLRKRNISVGAIQTTTKYSFENYKEIVDTYIDLGLNSIFLRPLTPLGKAKENWNEIGYTSDEFIDFYKKSIDYILEKNKNGYMIVEGNAKFLLTKAILNEGINYMEQRSPCGATIGQLAFYYDGDIYTCDEGRMLSEIGVDAFKIGEVENSNYNDLLNSNKCKTICSFSCLESIPECCDCVYSPYCGICPAINYAETNDFYPKNPNFYKCALSKGMFKTVFDIIYIGMKEDLEVLNGWLR